MLVAVGGGGLIGGVAAWFAGDVRVVGVEPETCPTLHAALQAGEPVDVEVGGLAADALGAMQVWRIGFTIARRFVDRVALVPDDAIAEAQRRLWSGAGSSPSRVARRRSLPSCVAPTCPGPTSASSP